MSGQDIPLHQENYDIAIIGAGGAGLMAAYEASKTNYKTVCISKVHPTQSHTVAAKGGINAALGNVIKDDWRFHAYDTVKSGHSLADHDSVIKMCKEAPSVIRQMENLGMPFTRMENGKIYQRQYGGQVTDYGAGKLAYRACAVADRTGQSIIHTLYQKSLENRVKFLEEHFVLNLLRDNKGKVSGLLVWDIVSGVLRLIKAKAIVIATGGFGYLYKTTTSSSICTGDAGALALEIGVPLMDMEFVQFHPTGLYQNGILITEAARAEGGVLRNSLGDRFMLQYDPKLAELACRDVIARAILQEIKEGRGCGPNKDYIELDLTHLSEQEMKKKIPTVYETVRNFAGINPTSERIPILPSVHYTMGGVPVDAFGRVSYKKSKLLAKKQRVEGLYAIGEAACSSVHGANRLGCNSLLEILVFGKEVVGAIAQDISQLESSEIFYEQELSQFRNVFADNGDNVLQLPIVREELALLMSQYAGVYRDAIGLSKALKKLDELQERFAMIKLMRNSLSFNDTLLNYLELKNLLSHAKAILHSASARKESRGAHFRDDYQGLDNENYAKHSLYFSDKEVVEYQDVRVSNEIPEMVNI